MQNMPKPQVPITPYAPATETGSLDWWNESTVAYLQGEFDRAMVASIMFHAESVEALRLLLLEGTEQYGKVMAMSEGEIPK